MSPIHIGISRSLGDKRLSNHQACQCFNKIMKHRLVVCVQALFQAKLLAVLSAPL
jgi:hypothetical protein